MVKVEIGLDEAGTGAWAGPVGVGCVVAPVGWSHPRLVDSKKMTEALRNRVNDELNGLDTLFMTTFVLIDPEDIDKTNPRAAVMREMKRLAANALDTLATARPLEAFLKKSWLVPKKGQIVVTRIIADGNYALGKGIESIVKADAKFPVVSAAALAAKVARDKRMIELDKMYPQYMLASNKGYGTPKHAEALRQYGARPGVHRMSYQPVKDELERRKQL